MADYQGNVIEIKIPYDANKAPDYKAISEKIDEHLKKHFKGQKIVVHAISGEEHPDRTIEDVLNHLLKHGTEKPEEKAKEIEPSKENTYDFLGNYHEVHDKSDIMSVYAKDNKISAELVAVYDAEHVEKVPYSDKFKVGDAYKFKHPDKKRAALKGVLKIIHEKKDAERKEAGAEQKSAIRPKQGTNPEPEVDEEEVKQLAAELGLDYHGAN